MYPKVVDDGYVRWKVSDDIFIEKKCTSMDCGPHCHDYIEIIYVCRGQLVQNIDGKDHYMSRGSMLLVDYDKIHSYHQVPGTEYYNIFLKLEAFEKSLEEKRSFSALIDIPCFSDFKDKAVLKKNIIVFSNEERENLEKLLSIMESEQKEKKIGYGESLKAATIMLINIILRKMSEESVGEEENISKNITEFIYENYSEKLTLENIALLYNYNPSYFGRLFKKNTGYSFREYLKRVRVEKAAELLRTQNMSVDDISIKVGYTNKTKFFEHFKSIMGETPYKYRKNEKKNTERVDKDVKII